MDKSAETHRPPDAEAAPASDAALVQRFAADRDEAAFAELLRRHGPAVLGVCRRVLRHDQDAEDAFQATFFVLARKAGTIRRTASVGSWLYGVALRIARKARVARERRPMAEIELANVAATDLEQSWSDLMPVLDEEIGRLPVKYRLPFVLCHLEGKTNEQAAREIGCPLGTVLSRLSRARERLRGRLVRRGVVLSGGALAAVLAENAAGGTVPTALAGSTLQGAIRFVSAGGGVPAAAAALARGYLRGRFWTRVAAWAACGAALAVVAALETWLVLANRPAALPVLRAAEKTAPTDEERIRGAWRLVSAEFGGQPLPVANSVMVFEGGQCTIFGDGARVLGKSYGLDPSQSPKAMDVVTDYGRVQMGIYAFDGDTLTICLTPDTRDRPTDFATRADSETLTMVLKRESTPPQRGPEGPPAPGPQR
jgi:RNA polymerase sigma factor (sigma-70 family)